MLSTFSLLVFSLVMTMYSYPRSAHAMAMAEPVLPDVAATTVMPGFRRPVRSALESMCCAMRSLMEPDGLRYSVLARMRTLGFSEYAERSKMGVPPMSCSGLTGFALGSAETASASSRDLLARVSRIWSRRDEG
jgi:hypothetical protein